jgi:hypothetical protein
MSSNYFLIAFIPWILSFIISRVYTLKYLDQPADYSKAPWWVRMMLNGGVVRLIELKKTAIIILWGAILFSLLFVVFSNSSFKYEFGGILGLMILTHSLSINWMDKNQTWGTEKTHEEGSKINTFDLIKKDTVLKIQLAGILLIITGVLLIVS